MVPSAATAPKSPAISFFKVSSPIALPQQQTVAEGNRSGRRAGVTKVDGACGPRATRQVIGRRRAERIRSPSISGEVASPSKSIIDAGANDLVSERYASPAINANDCRCKIRRIVQADMKIFELRRPAPVERIFDAGTSR